jgi:hypothetical protein
MTTSLQPCYSFTGCRWNREYSLNCASSCIRHIQEFFQDISQTLLTAVRTVFVVRNYAQHLLQTLSYRDCVPISVIEHSRSPVHMLVTVFPNICDLLRTLTPSDVHSKLIFSPLRLTLNCNFIFKLCNGPLVVFCKRRTQIFFFFCNCNCNSKAQPSFLLVIC